MEKKKFIDFLPESFKAEYLKLKKAFQDAPPTGAPVTPPVVTPPAAPQAVCYPVDGGQPVYVDISDDGIPDIDVNDKVFSDQALTTPYPDGTYKVTGTDFGFTVAAGVVSAVTDPDSKGPGMPMGDMGMKDAALADYPWEQCIADQMKQYNDMNIAQKVCGSIKNGSVGMREHVKAMSEIVDLQIQLAKQEKENKELTQKFEAQSAEVKSTRETVNQLFEMVGKIMELPTEEPIKKPENKKSKLETSLEKYINRK